MHQVQFNSLYVGDLHGRIHAFEEAVELFEKENLEKLVLLGDYVDGDTTDVEVLYLLNEVINYKKNNLSKVVCLIGNHDQQYHRTQQIFRCSGFRPSIAQELNNQFNVNSHLFQAAFKNGDFISTHAGVLKGWMDGHSAILSYWASKLNVNKIDGIVEIINGMWNSEDLYLLNTVPIVRGGSPGTIGGPIWADSSEILHKEWIPKFSQISGHNRVDEITAHKRGDQSFIFTDCLSNKTNFLCIKNQ